MAEGDCVSILPDHIIHHILSFLPMDAVVRTSVLSTRWLHQWKFVDVIHFPSLPELENEMDYGFVDRCLALMRAPTISKFIIIAQFGAHGKPNIANWIIFSIANRVRSLEFYMEVHNEPGFGWEEWQRRDDYIELPESFYLEDTESRVEIALTCVDFIPSEFQQRFQGYKSLRRLFLYDCLIYDKDLEHITSTCKILESLSIIKCSGLRFPKLSSTTLKEFAYSKYPHYMGRREFGLDAPNLVSVNAYCTVGEISGFNHSFSPLEVRLLSPREPKKFSELYDAPISEDFFNSTVNYTYDYFLADEEVADYNYDLKRCHSSIRLLSHLTNVQVFGTNNAFFPVLAKALHYNGGPCNLFRSLKEFYFLWQRETLQKDEVVVFFTFLGDCPSLTKIQLELAEWDRYPSGVLPLFPLKEIVHDSLYDQEAELDESDDSDNELGKYKGLGDEEEAQLSMANTLNQVKSIELYYYYGTTKADVDIVKSLLMKAVNLECLSLFYERPKHYLLQSRIEGRVTFPSHLKQQLLTELSLLPRASPCAKICFG